MLRFTTLLASASRNAIGASGGISRCFSSASAAEGHILKGDILQYLKDPSAQRRPENTVSSATSPSSSSPSPSSVPPPQANAAPVSHSDYDVIGVSDHSLALAKTYSASKHDLAHAYLSAEVDASSLREHVDRTGISVLSWLAKAAANAVDSSNDSIAVIQEHENGVSRTLFRPASAFALEEMNNALQNGNHSFDSDSASLNVFEHTAMSVTEIIPTSSSRMAVSVGGEQVSVGVSEENTPKLMVSRSISLTFDAATVEAADAAATLERFAKAVSSPASMLL